MRACHYLLIILMMAAAPGTHADAALDSLASTMAARLQVMEDVAHYKWAHDVAVDAPKREAGVIAATVEKALAIGLDRAVATRAVTAQMAAAKQRQRRLIAVWTAGTPPAGNAPDLTRDIRPRINRLTVDFLAALKSAQPALAGCAVPPQPATIDTDIWHTAVAGIVPAGCAPD